MEDKRNIFGKLCFITLRKAKTQLKHKNRFVQCMEMVLWLNVSKGIFKVSC